MILARFDRSPSVLLGPRSFSFFLPLLLPSPSILFHPGPFQIILRSPEYVCRDSDADTRKRHTLPLLLPSVPRPPTETHEFL